MKIKQVRNATLLIEYAGVRFLVDPMLAPKGAYPGFEGTANSHLRNPLVDLIVPMDEIVDVDAVIVTHTHPDHWDDAAVARVPKDLPLFAQNQKDRALIESAGFSDVHVLAEGTTFKGVSLTKTPGQHGSDQAYAVIGEMLGEVCGIVFKHPSEKILYVAGDTVWNAYVHDSLKAHRPDVIVLNCGDAQVPGLGSLVMGKQDVFEVYQASPQATLIASHMEAVNHCVLTRRELREFLVERHMTERVVVPEDGEVCTQ
jgi:L-ascorbate metabolism protein UlaG (beta-lactamase superfamily)